MLGLVDQSQHMNDARLLFVDHDDVAVHFGIIIAVTRGRETIAVIVADHAVVVLGAAIIADRVALSVFIAFAVGALLVAAVIEAVAVAIIGTVR